MQPSASTIEFAAALFNALAVATADTPGVTRDAYGNGEQVGHDIVQRAAEQLGALVRADAAGNLYMTRAGANPMLPAIVIGSHLDSVPHGGNYDGAAGVVAGLAVLAELSRRDITLSRDITIMAIRAEEAVWFPVSYPGSKAALGLLPVEALDVRRIDTGRTLAEHMATSGFDPEEVRKRIPFLRPERIEAFVELHIEQGPRLLAKGLPLAIVTAINGGLRYPTAKVLGSYAHSGAEPRFSRQDSVLGFSDLVQGLEGLWDRLEADGHELTITFGRVETDPSQHGGSRVLGELGFSLDIRCEHQALLKRVDSELLALCQAIEQRRGVEFVLGEQFVWPAAYMDPGVVSRLQAAAGRQDLPRDTIASGAGHDSAVLAEAGVASAMIFIRSANGSHNPEEHMDISDLARGVAILVDFVEASDG